MKQRSLLTTTLLAFGVIFFVTGCASFSPPSAGAAKRPPTYALIVSVSGGLAPTDAQWASMQKKFGELLAARGLVLMTDPTNADKLIQVLFVPNLADPSTGISYIVATRDNLANLLAASARASSASYSYTNVSGYASAGFQPQFYGYFNDYNDYGSISAPTPTGRPPTNHPGLHHVSRPVDCPPDAPSHPPSGHTGGNPSHPNPPSDGGGHWWNSHSRSDSGSSDYSSASSSSGSSGSSRSPSDFVGPTSSSAPATYSAPSMSFPSATSSAPTYSPPPAPSPSTSSSSDSSSHYTPTPEKPL